MKHYWKSFLLSLCLLLAGSLSFGQVSLVPQSAQVGAGGTIQFSASSSGAYFFVWGLSGAGCEGLSCGSITSGGLYTAPKTPPSPAVVTVTATAFPDVTQSSTAMVIIGGSGGVGVVVAPASASLVTGGSQQFTATVTGTTNTAVNWTVSGVGCAGSACGTISSTGLYTAPATVPGGGSVTVLATSVADSTKSAAASVTVTSASTVNVTVSPGTAQVSAGSQQQFTATVTGSSNTAVTWSLSGAGCSGSTCGSISSSGLYTAPSVVPSNPQVTVTAVSVASPGRSGTAAITVVANSSGLTISPASVQVRPGTKQQFTASGTGSGIVVWSISGSSCSGVGCGSISFNGVYTAPSASLTGIVTVTATSLVNPSVTGSATVTVEDNRVSISVSPSSIQLDTGATQQFAAAVSGTTNTAVTWTLSGYSCAGAACGTISSSGLYTAPATPPSPAIVFVTATSVADTSQTSSATVTLVAPLTVRISPTSATVATNGIQQFTATTTGTTSSQVIWTVSGTGCKGVLCGTLSGNGLYTAPPQAPNPPLVTVTATSIADSTTSASAAVTILVPVSVSVLPASASLTVGQTLQLQAQVSGTSNTSVTWSLSGPGCSGSACGTLTNSGFYTAPDVVPQQSTVVISATSSADPSASSLSTITILPSSNAKFSGSYAFLFRGFDNYGVYQVAGSIQADGNGFITSGQEDVNSSTGPSNQIPLTGTYKLGADNRGILTLNSWLGTQTFSFALNQTGNKGELISFDQTGVRGSGVIKLQDPTAFDPFYFANGYVLNLSGVDLFGARIGAVGLIFPDGWAFVSGSSLDVNEGGMVNSPYGPFSGTYSIDFSGRGTMNLSIPGFGTGFFNFAFYVVSANEFLMVSTDQMSFFNPIFAGEAELQTGTPFNNASFQGASIFGTTGLDNGAPDSMIGRLNFDGVGAVTANYDENDAGQVTIGGTMSGSYSLQYNGRGTMILSNPGTGGARILYIYAIAPNKAYILDGSSGLVSTGIMLPQQAPPPFSNESVIGTYAFAPQELVAWTTPMTGGTMSFDGGATLSGTGTVDGTENETIPYAVPLADERVSGAYSVSTSSNNGRGVILLNSPSQGSIAIWVASASQFFGLSVDENGGQPTILSFIQ